MIGTNPGHAADSELVPRCDRESAAAPFPSEADRGLVQFVLTSTVGGRWRGDRGHRGLGQHARTPLARGLSPQGRANDSGPGRVDVGSHLQDFACGREH